MKAQNFSHDECRALAWIFITNKLYTLAEWMDIHWYFLLQGIFYFLLQGIFPNQGSNPGLPHCRQTLLPSGHQGSGILNKDDIIFKGTKIDSWDLSGLNSIPPNLCPPRTSEYVLIRNRVFEDIIKVRHERRSFWMRVNSNPMRVFLQKTEEVRGREKKALRSPPQRLELRTCKPRGP